MFYVGCELTPSPPAYILQPSPLAPSPVSLYVRDAGLKHRASMLTSPRLGAADGPRCHNPGALQHDHRQGAAVVLHLPRHLAVGGPLHEPGVHQELCAAGDGEVHIGPGGGSVEPDRLSFFSFLVHARARSLSTGTSLLMGRRVCSSALPPGGVRLVEYLVVCFLFYMCISSGI